MSDAVNPLGARTAPRTHQLEGGAVRLGLAITALVAMLAGALIEHQFLVAAASPCTQGGYRR